MPRQQGSSTTWTPEKDKDLLFAIVMTHLTEQKGENLQLNGMDWGRVNEMMTKFQNHQTTALPTSSGML